MLNKFLGLITASLVVLLSIIVSLRLIVISFTYYTQNIVVSREYIFEHKNLSINELIVNDYRIFKVKPPPYISIDVENIKTGKKIMNVRLGKYFNGYKDYLWVGRYIKLHEPKEPRSTYTFYCPLDDIKNTSLNPLNQ